MVNYNALDPRPDLTKDAALWNEVLALANRLEDDSLFRMLEALRLAECPLYIKEGKLHMTFNRTFLDEVLVASARKRIAPYKESLRKIFDIVAKNQALDEEFRKTLTPF